MSDTTQDDEALLRRLAEAHDELVEAIGTVIVGQKEVVELMLAALFAQGHCLFVGVPGLAKTLLVATTARALGLDFKRVQFTPDLMPSDITGTDVLEEDRATGRRSMRFLQGPVFTNLLLADEINRTPPKTQAALLQAMQERQVTASGHTHTLERPFQVFATQNPIEQEGTYPLPEAQLDRFMFAIDVGYPSEAEELEIVQRTTVGTLPEVRPMLHRDELIALQDLVRRMPASSDVVRRAVSLARATRPGPEGAEAARSWISWGAGPRASQYLVLGAKVWAALRGREVPAPSDIDPVALAVLRHRVVLNFQAEAQGVQVDAILRELMAEV